MYLISGADLSKVQRPYSPLDFHQTRHRPYPLPTDFRNVPDFRFKPAQSTTLLRLCRFSPNLTTAIYRLSADLEYVPDSGSDPLKF